MRVALISIAETLPGANDDQRRGMLRFAGRSLAAHQIGVALAMHCDRIVCLTQGIPPGHLELQQASEAGGAQFHLVGSVAQLSGLVRAADELFVFAEGVLLPKGAVLEALDARSGVLAVAGDKGVSLGFERLDPHMAWAGVLRSTGSAVERLTKLPSDIEPIAALLRICLQSGARLVPLPDSLLDDGTLAIFETEAQVVRAQDGWLRRSIELRSWAAPGLALADRIVARFAARLLGIDPQGWRAATVTMTLAALAMAISAFAGPALGYAMLVFAALASVISAWLDVLSNPDGPRQRVGPARLARWAVNAAIIGIPLVAALPEISGDAAFSLAAMIAVLTLAGRLKKSSKLAIFGDRIVLTIILAAMSAAGLLIPTVQLLTLGVLVAALVIQRRTQR